MKKFDFKFEINGQEGYGQVSEWNEELGTWEIQEEWSRNKDLKSEDNEG